MPKKKVDADKVRDEELKKAAEAGEDVEFSTRITRSKPKVKLPQDYWGS